jgi:phosphate starvation-inducible PhoH-like protein
MEFKIQIENKASSPELFGPADQNLKTLRNATGTEITARNGEVTIKGEKNKVQWAAAVIEKMQNRLKRKGTLTIEDMNEIIDQAQNNTKPDQKNVLNIYSNKNFVEPITPGQKKYINMMQKNDLTFCIGPAGTGKTYLAVAMAVSMLKKKQIRKIVLARPAVEAGERLGFLPGDLQAKVNPYLRPLFDSLEDMMEFSQMRKFMDLDIIEVIPLAFMRGRTLNEAVVICDEAQNTLPSQMLMFLTRLGRGSKMIITGDITQVDLERGQSSGMIDAMSTLEGVTGIGSVKLGQADIVRHALVQQIVQAYEHKKKLT